MFSTEQLKIKNYSSDLCVVFWINRNVKIDLSKLDFSGLKIQQLWFMGDTASSEVILHGGNLRDLISGLCWKKTLSDGQIQTRLKRFKPYKPANYV
jgi:hypothetical protein